MKNTILLSVLCLFAGILTATAQGGGNYQRRTVEERVKTTLEKLTPELKLEANQTALTDSAFTGYYRSMDKLREGMQQGTRPDRTQYEKLIAERDEKLKKVFSAEQYKKFKEELEATMRPGRGGNRPAGGGNAPQGGSNQ